MEDPDAPILPKWARVNAKKARKEARRSQRKSAQEAEARGEEAPLAVNLEAAVSIAHRFLPPIPSNLAPDATTICLCYQYKEPTWTKKQHKHALNTIIHLAREHQVTGRGRCAPEGLNATLTANAQNMRNFCYALRAWDPLFEETDFKLSDGEIPSALFRTFTLRKVDELVGYGLGGAKAPSLSRHAGVHLEAHEYHETMKSKDTVIIDVRNAYESAIGHFQPPDGGAQLLDPKMRNSTDFPRWLNAPETKEKLQGKTVMMYCTGGIRCERATALLNQMTEAEQGDDGFKTKDVVMVRGGIERYLKTFPEGGYWKGKNYLFDKRMEQVPILKTGESLQADMESECCLCSKPYASYRGQFKCSTVECAVPVIVCHQCQKQATESPDTLKCPLCVDGYEAPQEAPDLVGQKRKIGDTDDYLLGEKQKKEIKEPSRRLFVGRLPLLVTATTLRLALITAAGSNDHKNDEVKVEHVQWILDRDTNAYYGSVFVQMSRLADAEKIVKGERLVIHATELEAQKAARKAASGERWGTTKMRKQKAGRVRLAFAPLLEGEIWSPMNHKETEFPPR
jgi:predicted sulfurtransferase